MSSKQVKTHTVSEDIVTLELVGDGKFPSCTGVLSDGGTGDNGLVLATRFRSDVLVALSGVYMVPVVNLKTFGRRMDTFKVDLLGLCIILESIKLVN